MKTLNAVKIFTLAMLFLSHSAFSQELIPATSEDQEVFDQQLEAAQAQSKDVTPEAAKNRKSGFGSLVADEAKKLKDSTVEGRKAMGQLISNQKRKNQTQAPTIPNLRSLPTLRETLLRFPPYSKLRSRLAVAQTSSLLRCRL